jgi:rubrerythrin
MDLNNFKEVVTFAIRKEAEAYNLYTTYSDLSKNPGTKVMFKELADEEQKHREILEGVEKKDVTEYKLETIPDLKISDFTDDQEFSTDMDYAAALRLAIKREEAALKLYNHIGAGTEHPELKKVFAVLAQEESKHKLRLESEYDENVLAWN